jgi:tetratricopeptide (TPR) repeat protein
MSDRALPTCPSQQELACLAAASLSGGEADESRFQALFSHVATCPECRAALDELRANERFLDEFAHAIAAAPKEGEANDETNRPVPILDGYVIGEELRHGGQGIVYRAVHEASGRVIALKVVRTGSHRRRARIEREAALAARLRHPNIVTIHDCGALRDGRYAIALELVEGTPLDEWSRSLGDRCSPRQGLLLRLRVFAKICDAIEHAHRHGVIHCDIKPDNVLIDRDDEPRVLDFGVARATTLDDSPRITVTGEIACTIAYASPEQLSSNRTLVDTRTDVYSLGVLLYELLAGRLPYEADRGISDLVAAISHAPPAPPSAVAPANSPHTIDRDLDTIALTALAKDPDRRYPTAAALKSDILHYLDGEPIAARRDSVAYVLRKALRRNWRAVAILSLAGLAVLIGVAATVLASMRAREASFREEAERSRMRAEARRDDAIAEMLREVIPATDAGRETSTDALQQTLQSVSLSLESGTFADDQETAAAARIAIGDVCVDQNSLRRAEVEYRQAIRSLRSRARPEDPMLGSAEERLARLLLLRSATDEALSRAETANAIRERTLGFDHPDTLHGLCTLVNIHVARGELDVARDLLDRMARHPILTGGSTNEVMDAVNESRAREAAARGDIDARRLHCEARARSALIAYGDSHPAVRNALEALAAALPPGEERRANLVAIVESLRNRTLFDAAPEDIRRLLLAKRELLGEDHPDLVETLVQLANRLTELEQWRETIETCLEAERIAMPDGVIRSVGLADLLELRADALWFAGDPNGSAELGARQLAALRPLLRGKDDMHLAVRVKELSFRYLDTGDFDRARALGNEALAIARSISEHDPHLGWMMSDISQNELRMGNPELALQLAQDGLALLDRGDRSYSWHVAITNYRMAGILARLGRVEESRQALATAREILMRPEITARERQFSLPHIDQLLREAGATFDNASMPPR